MTDLSADVAALSDKSLLVLDDDASLRTRLGRALEQRGFEPTLVGSVSEALVGFVADRADEPAAGLTRERLAEIVGTRAGSERSRDLLALLDRCDYLAFTPAAGSAAEAGKLLEQARALIGALERGFARKARS